MLSHLAQVGDSIKSRRSELGLSQALLARLTGLTRQTISGLESGKLRDLGFNRVCQVMNVIGLVPSAPTVTAKGDKRALRMAATSASVSYRSEMPAAALAHTLATGDLPSEYIAHVGTLLEEAPIPLLVMAVEEASEKEHVTPQAIWKNVAKLAETLDLVRHDLFK